MNVSINKVHYPVKVLGYGRRICIWFQGCGIRCPGCISQDTWEDDSSREISVEALVSLCRPLLSGQLDGITITGGEPFHQPEALKILLEQLIELRSLSGAAFDILCYSGHPAEQLASQYGDVLSLLDAIIPGPFDETLPHGGSLCGSENQDIVPLSRLGAVRYAGLSGKGYVKRMQVAAHGGKLWFIGVPDRGDMEKVEEFCESKGVMMKDVSWRA